MCWKNGEGERVQQKPTSMLQNRMIKGWDQEAGVPATGQARIKGRGSGSPSQENIHAQPHLDDDEAAFVVDAQQRLQDAAAA